MEAPTARHWVFGSVGVVMLGLIGYFGQARLQGSKPPNSQHLAKQAAPKQPASKTTEMILVEIRGAVKKPGIYEVKDGIRTRELIELAGGILPSADGADINQVRILRDGTRIDVPFKSEPKQSTTKKTQPRQPRREITGVTPGPPNNPDTKRSSVSSPPTKKMDLNTCSLADLEGIPVLSTELAERIYKYKLAYGPVVSWQKLRKATGVSAKKLEQLKEWLIL